MLQSLRRLNIPEGLTSSNQFFRHPQFQVTHRERNSGGCLKELESGKAVPSVPTFSFYSCTSWLKMWRKNLMTQGTEKNSKALISKSYCTLMRHWSWPKTSELRINTSIWLKKNLRVWDLSLNHSKCCYIAYNWQGQVFFQNGDRMTSTDEAKYLGASITQTINPRHEIRKRISATMVVLKKLDVFWLKSQCSKQNMETLSLQCGYY